MKGLFSSRPGAGGPAIPWLMALVALVVAVASLALYLTERPPGDESPEAGFARDMMVHHAQAVEMAGIARDRTQSEEIKTLATDIILTQQAQIGQMQGWLNVWGLPATGTEPPMTWMGMPTEGMMPGMATRKEANALRNMPPKKMDEQFLRLMIPHHRAAIPMAQAVLERTDRPEVEWLASSIVAAQKAEIRAMQEMLKSRGAPPVEGDPPMNMGSSAAESSHDAGFAASAPMVLRDTARLAPLPLAVFAAAWFGLRTVRRRRARTASAAPPDSPSRVWRAAAVTGLAASAALHVGLVPEHFEEMFAYGLFFSVAGVGAAIVAAAILAWPSRPAYLSGAGLAFALIALWVLFRLVPPPGSVSAEEVDLVGLLTKAAELTAALACVVLWSRSAPESAEHPEMG